ncbi:MAG: DUF4956 domain-containing protein [Nitrospina sp.]|jgi:hypothetical protein|nr:DUF4956 domain-containing protein [Nitrospina sp.]MBT3511005.1 DUF4956 domain-containing protein [Nitrospina sp.]MBT4047786.1 DUF4956 domain-containing protein [Nitrospina sp.]MBT4556114.1 DUF4956 domain-containing protein [Nitrospina sp.]MBT6739764.1 DUF4956 domain-containing protein [Nitrospina sp.]
MQGLELTSDSPLSLMALLMSLGVGTVLSLLVTWHFKKFGSTLSNREEFAQVFPFVLLTTVLIISVVKSSLALSLGLVGALSIVRFRTPIKEPEELAYLFISIAMGLGLGANQILATVVAGPLILLVMAFIKGMGKVSENKNLYLSIDWQSDGEKHPERYLERLNDMISKHVHTSDLRRFDVREESVEVTYFLDIIGTENLNALVDELRGSFPRIGVTFLDQNRLPNV